MKESFLFDYIDEVKFKKLERSLKKYNMLAYKKLYFEFYPALKEGKFLGELVEVDESKDMKRYRLKLPTDAAFAKKYGNKELYYIVYEKEKLIKLDTIQPEDILKELETLIVSKQHSKKDMFKIDILNMLQK